MERSNGLNSQRASKVLIAAKVENLQDIYNAKRGKRRQNQVRSAEFSEAMADMRATYLSLPARLVQKLGLDRQGTRHVRTANGVRAVPYCGAVRLTIQGRRGTVEVLEVPNNRPVVIGQVPLGVLDLMIDPIGRGLIGNPEHGGEQMGEQFFLWELRLPNLKFSYPHSVAT
jgi:predicted aspartyl protease